MTVVVNHTVKADLIRALRQFTVMFLQSIYMG